jgi:hypothetical protein
LPPSLEDNGENVIRQRAAGLNVEQAAVADRRFHRDNALELMDH